MPPFPKDSNEIFKCYPFYGAPDGEKCLEKTYYYTKYSGLTGAVFSVYEMVFVSKPMTVGKSLARFAHFTLPFAGMGFVFGSTVCLAGQLRKKSDMVNHLLAGMAAGSVWGFKYNRIRPGHVAAVWLGVIAAYFKYFDDHNIPTFRMEPEEFKANYPPLDFSIKFYDDP
ncbi:NADH dehydrogenase [ubiquinone] 1 alpha subcomplex subunit 11, partial [Stegodyphus mimosarum]